MLMWKITDILEDIEYSELEVEGSEVFQLLDIIIDEYYHVSLLGDTLELATNEFLSIINRSWHHYGQIIRTINNLITDNVLEMHKIYTKEIEHIKSSDHTEDEADDFILHKYNDTPRGSNNPNLITDTYLTASDRNEVKVGERHRFISEDGSTTEITTDINNIERLQIISNLENILKDYYGKWLKYIDKKCFIYDLYSI